MINRKSKISLLITLCYWLPSCYTIYDIVTGSGEFAFSTLGLIFLPGYFLGFLLGYGGGNVWVVIGQLITLILLYLLVKGIVDMILKKKSQNIGI